MPLDVGRFPLPASARGILKRTAQRSWRAIAFTVIVAVTISLTGALIPWALGRLLDSGIEGGLTTETGRWAAILGILIIVCAAAIGLGQATEYTAGLYGSQPVANELADRSAHNARGITRVMSAGDVVTSVATCCTRSTSICDPARPWRSSAPPVPASRRSGGCSPASTRLPPGASRSAGCRWSTSPRTSCAATSSSSPRSTTCSSGRSPTTSAWPAPTRPTTRSDGRITELGTHDDLVARGGDYADLWRAWTHE